MEATRDRAKPGMTATALGYTPDGPPDFGLDRTALAGSPRLRPTASCCTPPPAPTRNGRRRTGGCSPPCWERTSIWCAVGTEAERERASRIAAATPRARVPDHAPLDAVARLIAGAAFVVGVDTGLAHLAAALGVPLIAIFSASEPGLTGPMGPGAIHCWAPRISPVGGRGGRGSRAARRSALIAAAQFLT